MFRHIVMLSFNAPLSGRDHEEIVRLCQAIKDELPGILELRFVANASDRAHAYTHAFVANFDDAAAHDHYQQAPAHAPLKQKIMALSRQLIVLDYEG
ncbi:Dabb family protein [Achromobacter veterisilvae]|jgi:uncharacterized protein YceH (UPF0502 family)|uniref:Dabb family protein n=1 Tax=Achromobacter veterisilvae TaxID=2069367 RepID=A0ABZ2RWR2_9BURK|nr:Dabb family protein [Achromobacter sp.]MCW0206372.1 Dabb family protein [Achromobacter sp.]